MVIDTELLSNVEIKLAKLNKNMGKINELHKLSKLIDKAIEGKVALPGLALSFDIGSSVAIKCNNINTKRTLRSLLDSISDAIYELNTENSLVSPMFDIAEK